MLKLSKRIDDEDDINSLLGDPVDIIDNVNITRFDDDIISFDIDNDIISFDNDDDDDIISFDNGIINLSEFPINNDDLTFNFERKNGLFDEEIMNCTHIKLPNVKSSIISYEDTILNQQMNNRLMQQDFFLKQIQKEYVQRQQEYQRQQHLNNIKNFQKMLKTNEIMIRYKYIPRPPHVKYDNVLFCIFKDLFFKLVPRCKTMYEIGRYKYTLSKTKAEKINSLRHVRAIDVSKNGLFTYKNFKKFIRNFYPLYKANKNQQFDFNIFYKFIKFVFMNSYHTNIKNYIIQLLPFKREEINEHDILLKIRSKSTQKQKKVYLLNLFHNYKTDLSALASLKTFKVLNYVYIKYPPKKTTRKERKIIWQIGKHLNKLKNKKEDIIFVFLERKDKIIKKRKKKKIC